MSDWTIALEFAAVAIPSSLMTLLLVFFNNQCFTRYTQLYGACTGMAGAVQELAQATSVHLAAVPEARWDACRYALASVMVVYLKVVDLAQNRPQRLDDEDWQRLVLSEEVRLASSPSTSSPTLGLTPRPWPRPRAQAWLGLEGASMPALLTPEEVLILKSCEGKETQVLQMWSLDVLFRFYQAVGSDGNSGAHGHNFFTVQDILLNLRRSLATIPNLMDMPVPFPYYHALVLLMFSCFGLYAIAFLDINSYLTPVAMFLITFCCTAVRELSSALANPFGEDEVDFNASKFMHKLRKVISFLCLQEGTWRPPLPPGAYEQDAYSYYAQPPPLMDAKAQPPPYAPSYTGALEERLVAQGQQIAALQQSIQQASTDAVLPMPAAPADVTFDAAPRPPPHVAPPPKRVVPLVPPPGVPQHTAKKEPTSTLPPLNGRRPRAPPPLPQSDAAVQPQAQPQTFPDPQPAQPARPPSSATPHYAFTTEQGVPRWRPGGPASVQVAPAGEAMSFSKVS